MTTLAPAVADDVIEIITGVDRYLALNTGDPGTNGANESTAVNRILVAAATAWVAPVDDTIIEDARVSRNANEINFGLSDEVAVVTHASIWTAATGGTFVAGTELNTPQNLAVGNPVIIPAGDLEIVGAGVV